jgi:hypothetical protein
MTTINPEEVYQAGYAAFSQGNFPKARLLASQCLAVAGRDSYWHYGALGLKCWAANFLGDNATVEREAALLLSGDAGATQLWFDGLALFNLGLVRQRARRAGEARSYFTQASQHYTAYGIRSGQPHGQALTNQFYAAVTRWASSGDSLPLHQLAQKLASCPAPDQELRHLAWAVELYQRRAAGEDVAAAAEIAARQGVSRAYLAYLLLEAKRPAVIRVGH